MLEMYSWLSNKTVDILSWLQEKELDAAVQRIKFLSRLSKKLADDIVRVDNEKVKIEQKYFDYNED